jgi:hypothetical protein
VPDPAWLDDPSLCVPLATVRASLAFARSKAEQEESAKGEAVREAGPRKAGWDPGPGLNLEAS